MTDVKEALGILRSNQRRATKPHARTHVDAIAMNAERIRALSGICGRCPNIRLQKLYQDGRQVIEVSCRAGFSPVSLYQKTPLGEIPNCPNFSSRN